MDFKFPSTEHLPDNQLDEYHLNNHHLLNDGVSKKQEEDSASQILSDYTASNSNTSKVSNAVDSGHYSFANISDNTTSDRLIPSQRRQILHNANKRSSYISSSGSLYSSTNYHDTLAPTRTPTLFPLSDEQLNRQSIFSNLSPQMKSIPENIGYGSFSTGFGTIPTADNISFQITTVDKNSQRSKGTSIKKSPSILSSSTTSLVSIPNSRSSKLKRSKAVRCKGGLLEFFTQIGVRTRKRLQRWKLAIRKKLFSSYHKRSQVRKKKQTTSHLKRANGYVSNIKRSMSSASLKELIGKNGDLISQAITQSRISSSTQKPYPATSDQSKKINRNSLRRTPSSIKRAASTLTNSHVLTTRNISAPLNESPQEQTNKTRLVRSKPSLSLNSIVRQPSIVVNNKVIPLSKLNADQHEFSITEEDEFDEVSRENDEYIIDTDNMKSILDDNSSIQESIIDESDYRDAEDHISLVEEASEDAKVANAVETWNHYLRSVIAQRILMRLQIAKFQQDDNNDEHHELINAIITDYENSESSSSSGFDTAADNDDEMKSVTSLSTSELGEEYDVVSSSIPSTIATHQYKEQVYSSKNSSMLSVTQFQNSLRGNIRRSLTLPVGIKV